MANKQAQQKKVFDAGSPGFTYTLLVSALALFAWAGVEFPDKPAELAGELTTAISGGGWYALLGIIASSIGFPIYNAYKKGSLTFKGIFGSTLTWVAIANVVFAGIALTGFVLPEGTAEALVNAVFVKDWSSLATIVFGTILPAVVRFIKDKNQAQA